jgi:hypothetical protein
MIELKTLNCPYIAQLIYDNSIDTNGKENRKYITKQSPKKKSNSHKRKSDYGSKGKKNEYTTKGNCSNIKNIIGDLKSNFSPRYVSYSSGVKGLGHNSKAHNSSTRKNIDQSSCATMKHKDMFIVSPNNKNNKIMKKKKEAVKKNSSSNSKIIRSGSASTMFHNNAL